jgi:DNA-binding GntR family transcriptional regulator
VARTTTAEQAAAGVRRLILNGEIAPGEPLVESHLAEAAGVSRNTMREAIRLLAFEGLAERRSNRVARVRRFTGEDIADLFVIRRLLEKAAIAGSAAATPDQLDELARAADEVALMAPSGDWQRITDADLHFHQQLVSLSGSPRMVTAYARLEAEIRFCIAMSDRSKGDPPRLAAEHQELARLVIDGQRDAAAALIDSAFARDEHHLTEMVSALAADGADGAPA